MYIKTILSQHRRDFTAIYECEHCGFTRESDGYDDKNFHENVMPLMECSECNKTSSSNYAPRDTKYPEW